MGVRDLESPPSMRSLYRKAIAGVGASALRRLPGFGGEPRELPDLELVLHDVEIDRGHLARYDHVCGFAVRDELPPTYAHIVAFPLAMQIMTDGSFPFPVIGLVHIGNRIEQLRPLLADERVTVRVSAGDLEPHDKGTQFKIFATAQEVDGAVAWKSESLYLHRERGGSSGKDGGRETEEPPRQNAVWKVPGDIGRRYAGVSGDRNPIHIHPLTARLFGMPKPIAHGMWMKARCLAAMEGELPESYTVDVRFKLPLYIPATVNFATWVDAAGRGFALHDSKNEKPHLTGKVTAG
jgi:acyl dehydratase